MNTAKFHDSEKRKMNNFDVTYQFYERTDIVIIVIFN